MNCVQLNIQVVDLEAGVRFYSQALGFAPQVRECGYAKWSLESPCLVLKISSGAGALPALL
jgi:hypothetical protein